MVAMQHLGSNSVAEERGRGRENVVVGIVTIDDDDNARLVQVQDQQAMKWTTQRH